MSQYLKLDKLLMTSGNSSVSMEDRKEAFTLFHSRTERFVRSRVGKQIRDHHQIEDLVQDTYTRLWRKAYQYKPQQKLFPYLDRIIKNIVINHKERHGKRWEMSSLESIVDWEERLDRDGNFYKDDVF